MFSLIFANLRYDLKLIGDCIYVGFLIAGIKGRRDGLERL